MLHPPLRRMLALISFVALAAVPTVAGAGATTIVPVSPAPDDAIASSAPSIVVDVVSGDVANVDPKTVRFTIDGRDVSDRVSVSGVELTYTARDLAAGSHRIEVAVDRGSLGRATYEWAFRVDPNAKPVATTESESAETAPMNGALPSLNAYGSDYANGSDYGSGSPDGTLQTMGPSPYYWGDSVPFMYSGAPGGYGYLTYGGIPGAFNLFPYAPGLYYGFVPIPIGYVINNPTVVLHFYHHNKPIIIHLHRPPLIVHKRDPAPQARRLAIEREMHVWPSARYQLHPPQTFAPLLGSPSFAEPHVYLVPRPGGVSHPHVVMPAPVMRAPRPTIVRAAPSRPMSSPRH